MYEILAQATEMNISGNEKALKEFLEEYKF